MTYDRACEILGYTTPKSAEANARLAEQMLRHLAVNAPIRYFVACDVLVKAAKR